MCLPIFVLNQYVLPPQFPELKENIRGEEESTFTNALGESITVEIQSDVSATADLLEKVKRQQHMLTCYTTRRAGGVSL